LDNNIIVCYTYGVVRYVDGMVAMNVLIVMYFVSTSIFSGSHTYTIIDRTFSMEQCKEVGKEMLAEDHDVTKVECYEVTGKEVIQ